MNSNHDPALYCLRCAFRPATRHVGNDRTCDDCLTKAEQGEIATWPMYVTLQEEAP